MKKLIVLLALCCVAPAFTAESPWPTSTATNKPWTRWWWPGSAVDRAGITSQLEAMAAAGIGGVEITPIYGARGAESNYLPFLSPRWVEMLSFATSEARRLGLGVDMATGTGWPFGGPGVAPADGSMKLAFANGQLTGVPTQMQVKRAAPGGEGLVLDPYSADAMSRYLAPFTVALAPLPRGALRSQFHDSFEYYDAGWTAGLPAAFRELNGYDIQRFAAAMAGEHKAGEETVDADTLSRVKGDYRRTLAKLHLDYMNTWEAWSHAHGFQARNQAHGSPGNLLDLYAAVDIPETESFGATLLPIPGLRTAPDDVNVDPDPPLNLIGRFASSAAHVTGKPLTSSETLTWLRENFREPPSAAKPQIDRLFTAGINHIFYHGMAYSPADAPWPGWFFYASSQLKPENPLWDDLRGMHAYVARVQSVLQAGEPDNDVLVYWPFDDFVDDPVGGMRQFGVSENLWFKDSNFANLALGLIDAGYAVDFVSDAQLTRVRFAAGNLEAPGGKYRVIVVPPTRRMDVATLAKLRSLAAEGAHVVFASLPEDVPGLGRIEERRSEFKKILEDRAVQASVAPEVAAALAKFGVRREVAASEAGIRFIRRKRDHTVDYFLVNMSGSRFDGRLRLAGSLRHAMLMNPLDGRTGAAWMKKPAVGGSDVYLQLAPGESIIIRSRPASDCELKSWRCDAPDETPPWRYFAAVGVGAPIPGPWQITFLKGGPELPAAATLPMPVSWTTLADPRTQSFSGTARYRVTFDAPSKADAWRLDLGEVREAARVRVNGVEYAAWSLPFELNIGALRPTGNVLEIDVTNLPANRIRDLDRRKVDWKIMREINLVSLKYKPFDASGWQVEPSGLLGPVRLIPLQSLSPR